VFGLGFNLIGAIQLGCNNMAVFKLQSKNTTSDNEQYDRTLGTADGGTVVKVLRYKSEGRWFHSRWCHWNFSLT
jgi:hypothetical protein